MRLSVVLATYNEEENLARCLKSVKDLADEIVVVDGQSTDKTKEIAKSYGARVIETTNKPMFHINKQMAIDKANGDWVLQMDADEEVDSKLKKAIESLLKSESGNDGFWIKRKNMFMGRWLRKGGQYPDKVIRLFRNGMAKLPQKDVHEQMVVKGSVGEIGGHLMHYNAPDFGRYLTNANRYTSLTAKKLKEDGVEINLVSGIDYLAIKPLVTFIKIYFRHKGFVDGFPGFAFALFSGLHHFLAYLKLWELEKKNLD